MSLRPRKGRTFLHEGTDIHPARVAQPNVWGYVMCVALARVRYAVAKLGPAAGIGWSRLQPEAKSRASANSPRFSLNNLTHGAFSWTYVVFLSFQNPGEPCGVPPAVRCAAGRGPRVTYGRHPHADDDTASLTGRTASASLAVAGEFRLTYVATLAHNV